MNEHRNYKHPTKHGNYQDKNNRDDAHRLLESLRAVLAAKRLLLASELNRTGGKRLANCKSAGNQTKNEKNFG